MAEHLTQKQRKALTVLADARKPLSRVEVIKRLRLDQEFSKLIGAFTKPGLGVEEGSLGKRGLVAAVSTHPIIVTITAKGLEAIGRARKVRHLPPEEAADEETATEAYVPTKGDSREQAFHLIKLRRGQGKFRNALCKRYGKACLISDCRELDVLEAAHIKPYRGKPDNHIENGLLLRTDLHTLFDVDKIGIEPKSLEIHVHPSILEPLYRELDGQTLRCKAARPSRAALQIRWEQYLSTL